MIFCPSCGSIMLPKVKDGKKVTGCSKCSYMGKNKVEPIKETITSSTQKIEVVKNDVEVLPTTEADCPKCKHKTAFYWTMQTRAADEGETKFLRCERCKHTWREYG